MPKTYTPIATTTLTSATATVTFSSIPQTYTDLVLVVANVNHSYAGTGAVRDSFLQFNTDTSFSGTNYSNTRLIGDGSSASSGRSSNSNATQAIYSMASGTSSMIISNIMNYTNSTTYKTVLTRCSVANGSSSAFVDLWRATPAAITTITCALNGYTYSAGSTFTLYGILKA